MNLGFDIMPPGWWGIWNCWTSVIQRTLRTSTSICTEMVLSHVDFPQWLSLTSPANADWSMHLLLTYQPATMRKDVPLILQTLRITVKHHTLWSRDIPQIHIQPLTHRFGRYSCSFCLRPPHALDFRMMQKPNAAPSTWMLINPKTIV